MKVQTINRNYNCQYLCSTAIDGLASIHLILSITSLDEVFKRMWPPVNPQAGPRWWSLSPPFLCLECRVHPPYSQLDPFSRMQAWESNELLRPSGLNMWLDQAKVSIYTFKILACDCPDLLILRVPKISLLCKFPCLVNPPPTNLKCSASPFADSLSPGIGANLWINKLYYYLHLINEDTCSVRLSNFVQQSINVELLPTSFLGLFNQ